MGNDNKFYVVTGMPVSKVREYQNATPEQKRYAQCFDANKNGIFDNDEVDLFNATTYIKADKAVIFCTQVKEKKWLFPSTERVSKVFKDEPNHILYDNNIKVLEGREVVPYVETNSTLHGLKSISSVGGVSFDNGDVISFMQVYAEDQYMYKVTLKKGTTIMYPDGQNGSVKIEPEIIRQREFGYTYKFGWDYDEFNNTNAGNGGWKWHNEEVYTGNYIMTFHNVKNVRVLNSPQNIKFKHE